MAVARWVLFTGLVWMTGCVAVRWLLAGSVAPTSGDEPSSGSPAGSVERRLGRAGLLATGVALLGMLALGAGQLRAFRDPFSPLLSEAALLFLRTSWGHAWILAVVGILLAGGAFLAVGRKDREGERGSRSGVAWAFVTLLVGALAFFPAFTGHAVGSERLTSIAVVADGIHVLAAGVWLGSLGVLLAIVLPADSASTGVRLLEDVLPRFSTLALAGAGILGTTGLFASWLHVPTPSALVESGYGRLLLLKLALVVGVGAAGFVNWRRWRRRRRTHGRTEMPARRALLELVVAHLVLAATAVLVGTTPPPSP